MPTVYITAPREAAADLAAMLVEEHLAACVNTLACESVYRWEGAVHEDEEAVLLAKTTDDAVERLTARVEEAHPYEVPCIERFDEDWVLPAFGDWRRAETE
jgi:periplasmic divalent cation tolerance protein